MIVYKSTNIANGKVYIGVTRQPLSKRIAQHKCRSLSFKTPFYQAIRKYGWDNFVWSVVCECDSLHELEAAEKRIISEHQSTNRLHGYNRTEGGGGTSGMEVSADTRWAIRVASKTAAARRYGLKKQLNLFHHNYLKTMSAEQKKKIGAHSKGKSSGRYKIHPAEWVFIHFRRVAGESYAKIAETYKVEASAIFHFYKRFSL